MRKIWLAAVLMVFWGASMAWGQNSQPIADAGDSQSVYQGDTVLLDGSGYDADGDELTYHWQFESKPEGSIAQLSDPSRPNPYFNADAIGEFVLTLTVSDGDLASVPDAVIIHVADNLPPEAVIVTDVTTGPAPLTVSFDATQSYDPEGRTLKYTWIFGDGTHAYGSIVTHEYTSVGSYVAALIVTDDRNQTDGDSVAIQVTAANNPPVVAATATPTSGTAPLTVQFAANASDPESDALSYSWTFGDGGVSTEANPAYTYSAAGTYVAWVEVSDGTYTASDSVTIVVEPAIEISTASLFVKWTGTKHSTQGNIHLEADVTPLVPLSDEVVRATVDGVELFSAPWSAFIVADDEGPDVYKLKAKNLLVKLDTYTGYLEVISHKLELSGIDNANGLAVELTIGPYTAVETVPGTFEDGRKLTYRR